MWVNLWRVHPLLWTKRLGLSGTRRLRPFLALGQDGPQVGDDDQRLVSTDPPHLVGGQQPPLDMMLGVGVAVRGPALGRTGLDSC